MHQQRFAQQPECYRLPRPRLPITANGFVACPVNLMQRLPEQQIAWQIGIYQLAYEQVQDELRPSLPERDLLAVWN
jgi:hypothetical protein